MSRAHDLLPSYATTDRKIVVVEEEAERVRTIFRRYLELGSLNRLMADLRERGIVTKVRSLKTGRTIGGIPFTRGPLAHFLRNRFYIGEVVFKGEVFPGEQPAILDRDLFDAVQAKLNGQRNNHTVARAKSESLLIGRIYDDRGNRMTPSHVRVAMDFLLYSYLQTGQDHAAEKVLDEFTAIESVKVHHVNIAYVLADMPTRYAVERRRWDEAAAISLPRRDYPWTRFPQAEAVLVFVHALGAARTGDPLRAGTGRPN
jgi:hypothetical protein